MMLRCAAFLDDVPFPGNVGIIVRIRIFPPPDFIALPIAAENNVRMAVPIDIANDAAGFDGQEIGFDDVAVPAVAVPAIPNQGRRRLRESSRQIR